MNTDANKTVEIVTRVSRPLLLEPLRLLADGISGVDETDRIMKTLGGFVAGPFETMDAHGLGVELAGTRDLWRRMGEPARLRPPELLADLVEKGHLGRESGRGFYGYAGATPLPAVLVERKSFDVPSAVYKSVRRFVDGATREAGSLTEQYVFARTLVAAINEAALMVDACVAEQAEIDAAMTQAAGWPRGPLAWAEEIGRHTCATLLRRLGTQVQDGRFAPAEWLNS